MKMQIIIRLSLIAFCVSMMIASAKAGMKEGISWYDNRHQDSKGFIASKINIDKAINDIWLNREEVISYKIKKLKA